MTSSGVPIVRLVIRHDGQWVDGIYKGGESRMRKVKSDLSYEGLMKLVEDVVGVNSEIDEIELHALISTPGELSRPIIKDDEDAALILLEQRNVPVVYVNIKGCQTNVMSHEEVGQHECVMPLSNENTTLEDNNVRLEGDTATLEDKTAFDEGNEDLFVAGEDRFDDTSDDGLEQWQDDSSDDDCLYDSDIPIYNNVEGETESVRGVDIRDVQCDDSDQEKGNAGISRTWVIAGVERFSFQTITIEESTCAEDRLYKGRMFSSKAELKQALNMLVIIEKFAIRVKRSCKARYEVGCKDKACKFSVRAMKLPDRGEYWQVRTFHKVHTCTVDGLQRWFPTTSAKMIGELMSHKLRANGVALRPKDIICEMRVQWGLECLYGKVWQAKEYAERLVFSPLEESFQLLPSYFYMLEQEIPGTVTVMATDEEERFKYCFWSYGACIRGFSDVMHPTVAIDATHLKGRFNGVLFVTVCKDANECVYPVGFGIDHVEDEDSWTWFLSKLRDVVGCHENTMFISNQHLIIKKVIQNAYPEIHLGAHTDLMRIGPEKWARACSPARRYQMMTSNIAECVNLCLKHARQMSITVLIEFIKDMFQRWFHDRYEEAFKVTKPLSPWVARQLSKRFNDAHRFVIEFIVFFSKCNREAIEFCADYYKTIILVERYSRSIRPAKWEDLGEEGFHQLVKAVEHRDVHNARVLAGDTARANCGDTLSASRLIV
ncbi:Uncharacterized protein TCM_040459 [Theobroma cacao]|uniref:Transposase MuDR plant domain-containing protein n=1 Tax=Theobroma cacao TaxID=3641 RepID=A0A061GTJ7_THECC|nr:Uncharacterized protein TCM_040459 [Theobroma cacao]